MTHYSVIVVTDEPPSKDNWKVLERALLPFHEFECTGEEYGIVEIDMTKETRMDYDVATASFYEMPDGSTKLISSKEFLRKATPDEVGIIEKCVLGFETPPFVYEHSDDGYLIHCPPDGAKAETLPYKGNTSFDVFLKDSYNIEIVPYGESPDIEGRHKYQYATLNDDGSVNKVMRRTNRLRYRWTDSDGNDHGVFLDGQYPTSVTIEYTRKMEELINKEFDADKEIDYAAIRRAALSEAKSGWTVDLVGGSRWDWYSVGGRYAGRLHNGQDVAQRSDIIFEILLLNHKTRLAKWWDEEEEGYNKYPSMVGGLYDITVVSSNERIASGIPIQAIPNSAWTSGDCAVSVVSGEALEFSEARKRLHDLHLKIQKLCEEREIPYHAAIKEFPDFYELAKANVTRCIPREIFTKEDYINTAFPITALAYVKDGVWREQGEVGWFGTHDVDVEEEKWTAEVIDMVKNLDPEQWITIVDCHI